MKLFIVRYEEIKHASFMVAADSDDKARRIAEDELNLWGNDDVTNALHEDVNRERKVVYVKSVRCNDFGVSGGLI